MYNLLPDLSIIEVPSFIASPTAGLYCAQMGAEVIRIDQIGGGLDYNRYQVTEEGRSLTWENLNRAKKSVAIDMRSEEGRELVVELARKTGQLITNVPEKSFLSHERIVEGRPDMITLRVMGWYDGRQAMDFTVHAASGYPLMTGPDEWDRDTAPPVNQILPAWDFLTGAYSAFALMTALRHRERTGEGNHVRVPLGDVMMATVANSGAMAEMLYRGENRERLGNSIWGALGRDFKTRDGERMMVAALTNKQWRAMIEAFDVADDIAALEAERGVSFAKSDHNRFSNRDALFAIFQNAADRFDYAELAHRLTKAGATFEKYRTMHEAASDKRLVEDNPLFGPSPRNPSGFEYPAAGSMANLPSQERQPPEPAPFLGQHSEEVLAERLGLASGEIARLIDRKLVAKSDEHNFEDNR
ncbi:carnitine dehydratase [Altererythrobacter aurantiacus]|uniref:Carnitine dehydratase n=1 Tax=Parapontixanthobacter aurantiacus TaxID=1463599 RepID=A0A844ZM06_9SPHN|nr:CoA transferase [Parapontixanthobacter aurantiacus]MXO86699.1 carnitine dehydratase [Parapontixanthobacter aurantiacus]